MDVHYYGIIMAKRETKVAASGEYASAQGGDDVVWSWKRPVTRGHGSVPHG